MFVHPLNFLYSVPFNGIFENGFSLNMARPNDQINLKILIFVIMKKKENRLISIDQEVMSGTPVFFGTRVPVLFFFDYIETGETVDEFLFNFPTVKKIQALQLLEIAKELIIHQVPNENFA
jgi:uncharacterized protein (DUF433 family)